MRNVMDNPLIAALQAKTKAAKEDQARYARNEKAREKRAAQAAHKKLIEDAKKEASVLFDQSQSRMLTAAEYGKNYYDVCKASDTERDKIILKRFTDAGFKADISYVDNGRGGWEPDGGGYIKDYDAYIRVSW